MSYVSNQNVKLAIAAICLVSGQSTIAHTRLETATVPEATRVHNYVNIGHGCADPTGAKAGEGALKNQPTFGTTVVFPNAVSYTPIIGVDSTSDGKGTAKVYTANKAADYYSPLAGIGQLINAGGPFPFSNIKVDNATAKSKDGFWAGGKAFDQSISTYVSVDFYSSAVNFVKTSCARTVTFELAIADICDASAKSPNIGDAQALFWSPIPNFTGVPGQPFGVGVADAARNIPVGKAYSNYDGWANGDKVGMGATTALAGDGWGSPATLTVTRNLTTNPLPAGCTGNGGKGDDIYVYPSADQINKELPIWSKPDQTGTKYWY